MCLNKYPVKIGSRLSPAGNEHAIYEYVSCRKCEECISIRKNQWTFRILQEEQVSYSAEFVTLTYNDENLPSDGVSVRDCQLFFKRLREYIKAYYPDSDAKIRYFLVSEYGSKRKRPHYHFILFNSPISRSEMEEKVWKKGFVDIGTCTERSVQYCLKYFAIKAKSPKGKTPNFCLMSKKIGEAWLLSHMDYVKSYVRMPDSNYKIPIPEFYRKKLGYEKRQYDWLYEPDIYERFSPKFLRSRGLLSRRALNSYVSDNKNLYDIIADSDNYYIYRTECFERKYKKCNVNDNQ